MSAQGTNVGTVNFKITTNTSAFSSSVKSAAKGAESAFSSSMKRIGGFIASAFAVTKIVAFGKECVKVANETQSAWMGLNSILNGQGKSFEKANSFIQSYIKDGLVPLNNAVTAYKNLAARGYSEDQIQRTMIALKDAAAFGRQASYSYGEAIQTATEGLKNENSILVDNAGVTKNVAKMWKDYAASIGTTADKLTQQQKIQAEVNGILQETKWQTGDAAKYAGTFAGRVAQLKASFTQLKTEIGNVIIPILNLFIPAVQLAMDYIMRFLNLVKGFMKSLGLEMPDVSSLSGFTNGANNAATAIEGLNDNLKDSSKAAEIASKEASKTSEKASKAAENQAKKTGKTAETVAKRIKTAFASFDEINVLAFGQDEDDGADDYDSPSKQSVDIAIDPNDIAIDASTIDTAAGAFEGAGVAIGDMVGNAITDSLMKKSEALSSFFDPITNAWNSKGKGLIDSIRSAFGNIKELFSEIKLSFANIWNNGTTQTTFEYIIGILQNIFEIVGNIATAFKNAWKSDVTGNKIIQNLADTFNNILGLVRDVGKSISDWWKSDSGNSLADNTLKLFEKLSGLAEKVTEKIRGIWSNGGKDSFESIESIAGSIVEIIEIIIGYIADLYSDFIDWFFPDAEDSLITINDCLTPAKNILDWLKTDGQPILEGIAYTIGTLVAVWAAYKAVTLAITAAQKVYAAVQTVVNTVMSANPAMLIVAGIAALIAIIILCVKHWDDIKAAGTAAWDKIKEKWGSAKTFLKDKVLEPIKDGFWGLVDKAKEFLNGIIAHVESFINHIINAVNWLKSAINSISFTVPDWVLGIGGKTLGFNLAMTAPVQLPRLAEGGWIAANNPQLAIVGDNTREGEIIAPESKIKDAVVEAFSQLLNGRDRSSDSGNSTEHIKLLREIVHLLEMILSKDNSVSISADDILSMLERKNRRDGVATIPI